MRNIITSMRLISDVDWTELFERVSLVDDVFEAGDGFRGDGFPDPQPLPQRRGGARPRFRLTELEVAHAAMAAAARAQADGAGARTLAWPIRAII